MGEWERLHRSFDIKNSGSVGAQQARGVDCPPAAADNRGMKRYVLAVAVFLNAGCVHRVAGLNLVSADAELAIGSVNSAARSYVMTGEVCQHFVVFPIGKPPTFEAAITKALEQAPGNNALVNATFSTRTVFLLLYAKLCYIASGTPMMLPVR